jgi:hypothetical protein
VLWNRHPDDRELLLTADSAPGDRRRTVRHLEHCGECQRRRALLQQAIDELTHATRSTELVALPPPAAARARLQTQLRTIAAAPSSVAALLRVLGTGSRWAHAAGVAVLFTVGTMLFGTTPPIAPDVFLLPIAQLTPGASRHVTFDALCGGTAAAPPAISPALHDRVFRNYRTDPRRATEYELDYLITPELGGATDVRNLWPQAYSRTPWNAFVKDELERLLHRQVCDGALDLTTAQQQMAADWIAAYKHYFRTDRPLRDYDAQPLAAADQDMLLLELAELGVADPGHGADGQVLLALLRSARGRPIAHVDRRADVRAQTIAFVRAVTGGSGAPEWRQRSAARRN